MLEGIRPSLSARCLPGAWPFAIQVNVHILANERLGPVARVIIGGLLGPASAALYRVASSLADSAQTASRPPRQGLLSRGRPHGPQDKASLAADAARHGHGQRLRYRRRAHRPASSANGSWVPCSARNSSPLIRFCSS
jgi:hypothetical protein